MSNHDHRPEGIPPEAIPPEEARALDALIASQTDTNIDEASADRLLSFLHADVASSPAIPSSTVSSSTVSSSAISAAVDSSTLNGNALGGAVPIDAGADSTASEGRPLPVLRFSAWSLALAAAGLLLFYFVPKALNPEEPDRMGSVPIVEGQPLAGMSPQPVPDRAAMKEANVAAPIRSTAIPVAGRLRKRSKPVFTDTQLFRAWRGSWVAGLDSRQLLTALRSACADAVPWPDLGLARPRAGFAARRLAPPFWMGGSGGGSASEENALVEEKILLGSRWLLRGVERGFLPRSEVMGPARVLLASRSSFRHKLVAVFRESRHRFERALAFRGRRIPLQSAELLGALGVRRSIKKLARALPRAQHGAVEQAVLTGDEESLGFLIDFLVVAHRLTPDLDGARLMGLTALRGPALERCLRLLNARQDASSRRPERVFLEGLRLHLVSDS